MNPDNLEPDDWPVAGDPDPDEGTATEDRTLAGDPPDYVDDGDAADDDEPG